MNISGVACGWPELRDIGNTLTVSMGSKSIQTYKRKVIFFAGVWGGGGSWQLPNLSLTLHIPLLCGLFHSPGLCKGLFLAVSRGDKKNPINFFPQS